MRIKSSKWFGVTSARTTGSGIHRKSSHQVFRFDNRPKKRLMEHDGEMSLLSHLHSESCFLLQLDYNVYLTILFTRLLVGRPSPVILHPHHAGNKARSGLMLSARVFTALRLGGCCRWRGHFYVAKKCDIYPCP